MAGKLEAIVFMLKWKTKYHGTTDILKKNPNIAIL
jgi:hypothetical protein